jgi:peptide/nickel transport system substrate-binding protein
MTNHGREKNTHTPENRSGAKKVILFLVLVVVLAIVATLAVPLISHFTGPRESPPTEQNLSNKTLSIGLLSAPKDLNILTTPGDPVEQALIGNVYETLTGRDQNNKVIPSLAQSWKISDDALTYTFQLAHNVTFSNGDPMHAKDVVWSLSQLTSHGYLGSDALKNLTAVNAPDNFTLILTLNKPTPDLLWQLSGRAGIVRDSSTPTSEADLAKTALGTGPYTVKSWTPGKELVLTANSSYWNQAGTGGIGTVNLKYYAKDTDAVAALKNHEIQAISTLGDSSVAKLDGQDGVTATQGTSATSVVLWMFSGTGDASMKGTSATLVRQAVRITLDNKKLLGTIGGVGQLLGGPITPLDPGYEPLAYSCHDVDGKTCSTQSAKDDSSAGVVTDVKLAQSMLPYFLYSFYSELSFAVAPGVDPAIANGISEQLKAVGITATPQFLSASDWEKKVEQDEQFNLGLTLSSGSHDLDEFALVNSAWTSSATLAASFNTANTANTATSEDDYIKKLQATAKAVSNASCADWLFALNTTNAWDSSVRDFPTNLTNTRLPLAQIEVR